MCEEKSREHRHVRNGEGHAHRNVLQVVQIEMSHDTMPSALNARKTGTEDFTKRSAKFVRMNLFTDICLSSVAMPCCAAGSALKAGSNLKSANRGIPADGSPRICHLPPAALASSPTPSRPSRCLPPLSSSHRVDSVVLCPSLSFFHHNDHDDGGEHILCGQMLYLTSDKFSVCEFIHSSALPEDDADHSAS